MTTNTVLLKIDGERVVPALQEVLAKLDSATDELALDFSAVHRLDAGAIRELEKLAAAAESKAIKVSLHAVSVDVYRVLKLVKLTLRFAFSN